ncbi:GAF and ANTAR domain-containing protein [Kineococcus gypseus]|uniref:GAF and ANTAR domain-containing protein n=1 Tax=Kineococcus gypseus TaxID=1637102 RepID=UPI003D7F17C5
MSVGVRGVAAAVDEVAALLAQHGDPLELADGLVRRCAQLLGAEAVGLLVEDSGRRLQLLAGSSGTAQELELFQLGSEEGPCVECHAGAVPVSCAGPQEMARRWPGLALVAAPLGVLSVHAEPLVVAGRSIGALGVFREREGALDEVEAAVVRAMAALGAVGFTQLERVAAGRRVQEQLQRALDSRVVLEQAKGVLAERHRVSPDEAFERLRAAARTGRRPLHDVAREVVGGVPDGGTAA